MAGKITGPSFGSDNHAGIHPDVLRAIGDANVGYASAYGADPWTERATVLFKERFGEKTEVFPVFNGTGANVAALSSVLKRFEGVICAEKSHIDVDECGAPETIGGFKLLTIPTRDQKLTVPLVREKLARRGDAHAVQPRVISITQSTELGTIYTLSEIQAISTFAHAEGLILHMDGARISNAAASLGTGLRECTTDLGVDLLSFGGTKNGLMGAEAVLDLTGKFATDLRYIQKQSMQLASKMRFCSAQLIATLENDLWRKNASNANGMARLLESKIRGVPGVTIAQKVEANAVFAKLPKAVIPGLQAKFPFYVWEELPEVPGETPVSVVRLMCSFQTTESDVASLADAISRARA